MKLSKSSKLWRASILGAIYGLLIGGITSAAVSIATYYHNMRTLEDILDRTNLTMNIPIVRFEQLLILIAIIICFSVLASIVSSYLAHRILGHRINSVTLIWQIIGFAAVIGAAAVIVFLDLLEYMSTGSSFFRYNNLLSMSFLQLCLKVVAILAGINLLFAGVINLSLVQYSRKGGLNLP